VGVPPLPRLLRGGLHHLLQLRALPQGGEWLRAGCATTVSEACCMRNNTSALFAPASC
jgi:hypothetical protein